MSNLKPLVCTQCGGRIDRESLVCNACGIAYRLDDNFLPVRIELSKAKVRTISGEVHLPREYLLDSNEIAEISLQKMAEQMAERILPLIEYTTEFDMYTNSYVTHGRLRVVDPHTL